jgi:ParB family chromosome partitioning protein
MAMPALPSATKSAKADQLRQIPVEKIKPGRWQPRRKFSPESLAELADSIEQQGVIQPVVLRFDKTDGMFELIAGERRWRASMQACVYEIPARVRNDLTIEQASAMSLVENIQREDLSPIEEAQALKRLADEFKLTHQEVSQSVGKSRSHVTNLLRLLDLSEDVQTLLDQGKLDVGHAKPLLPLPKRYQIELATMAIQREWSVRILTERVNDTKAILSGQASRQTELDRDPNINRLERLISEKYCLPCQVTYSDSQAKGKLILTYHSIDELQGLVDSWGIES